MADLPSLDGPRHGPAQGGAPDALVVLIHGYGANGEDLIGLAPHLAQVAPGAAFVSPDAPLPLPGSFGGRQWFPISRLDPAEMEAGVREAAPILNAFIDAELERLSLPADRLVLAGFSQGSMLAMHVAPRRDPAPAALIGWSGALCGPEALKDEIVSRPPTLLIHGDQDEVVPAGRLMEAAQGLGAAGVPVAWHMCQGVGHGISPEGLSLAAEHMARALHTAPAAS